MTTSARAGYWGRMRAIVVAERGGPDALTLTEVADPGAGPGHVLVRVRAAGVNPIGVGAPPVPGTDVAGTVVAVGPAVELFAVGDQVIGSGPVGAYAELVAAPEWMLAAKPASVSFEEAAGLPTAGLAALAACRAARVGPGDTVLVHGAESGIGHLAVQLADAMGAGYVLGTAGAGSGEFVRSLGAWPVPPGDDLVDRIGRLLADGRVDVALDCAPGAGAGPGGVTVAEQSRKLVRREDRHVSVVDPDVAERGGRYVSAGPDGVALAHLAALVEAGKLIVCVRDVLELAHAAEAHRMLAAGDALGKLVLRVS